MTSRARVGDGKRSTARGLSRLLRGLLRALKRLTAALLLGVYLLISRTIVFVAAIYLAIYFFSGTRTFRNSVQSAVSATIPGTMTAATVQWGPAPWEVRIANARVTGEFGQDVLVADAIIAKVDLLPTLAGLARFILKPDTAPLRVWMSHVTIGGVYAAIDIDEQGHVGFERAFYIDDPNDPEPAVDNFDIVARSVRLVRVQGHVSTPEVRVVASGVTAVSSFALTGDVHVGFFIPLARIAQADVILGADDRPGDVLAPLVMRTRDLEVVDFNWDGEQFAWRQADGALADGRMRGAGRIDLATDDVDWSGSGSIQMPDGSALTEAFSGGQVRGAMDIVASGAGTMQRAAAQLQVSSPALTIAGVAATRVEAQGGLVPRRDGHALAIARLEAQAFGGGVEILDGRIGPDVPTDDGPALERLAGQVTLEDVDARSLSQALLPDIAAQLGPWLGGQLSGAVTLDGTVDPDTGDVTRSIASEGLAIDWAGHPQVPLDGRYQVSGTAAYAASPAVLRPSGAITASETLTLTRVLVDSGPARFRVAGNIDLTSGELALEPYLRLGNLRTVARRLGLGDLDGRFVLKAAALSGTLNAPKVRATLNWTAARMGHTELGRVRANLGLTDGLLSIKSGRSQNALGKFDLDGQVQLFRGGLSLDPEMPFHVTRLATKDMDLTLLLPELGDAARLDVSEADLRGRLRRPLKTVVGNIRAVATNLEIAGEPVRRAALKMKASDTAVMVPEFSAILGSGHRVDGEFTVARDSDRIHGRVSTGAIPFRAFRGVRRSGLALLGTVGVDLSVGGTLERPTMIGRVALADVMIDALDLGDAELDLQSLQDGRVGLSSARFFRGFELLDQSEVELTGFVPRHAHIAVRAQDAKLTELLPGLADGDLEVTTRAAVTVDLWPQRRTRQLELSVAAAPGEVVLGLRAQGLAYTNETALTLTQQDAGLVLAPMAFRAYALGRGGGEATPPAPSAADPDALLLACGSLATSGALDVRLAGAVDLGILTPLKDVFSVVTGRLRIARDDDTEALVAGSRCLPDTADGVLQVSGTLSAPRVAGRVEPFGVAFIPRGLGREVRLKDGAGVELRPGEGADVQLVESDPKTGVVGEIDDGSFRVWGDLTLQQLAPRDANLDFVGTDLFFASPGEFNMTFNPRGVLRVRGFGTPEAELGVRGQVLITDGRFYRSFDAFAEAFGGAVGGRQDQFSDPILEKLPWLGAMTLDVDVTSSEFAIDSAFPLGKAEMDARLDLTVDGIVAAPQVHRRVDLLPGGILTYRVFGREFELVSGSVDFDGDVDRPRLDIRAQTEVTYLARASTDTQDEDEKEVVITLTIRGQVPDDLKIEMTSDDPTLDQADLQSLILTGKPRRELDRSQGESLVTADLATLLNDVLKSPFVRTASVGLSQSGYLQYNVGTCLGPDLCFSTTAVQETTETQIRARFRLHLSDNLTCDGTLRRSDQTVASEETYEARCRYRIPLD